MNILKKLTSLDLRNPWKNSSVHIKRLLYSPASLGMNEFIKRRQAVQSEIDTEWDLFKKKIKNTSDDKNLSMIFSSDVIKMVYKAVSKEDLDLVHKLLKKLKSQKLIKVRSYNCGSEVMKLHYLLNKPLEAKRLVEDPVLYTEFHGSTSFLIFLDLLYKNNLYEDIIKMYNLRLKQSEFSFFTPIHVIYFAACYKLNSKDSFNNAFKVWQVFLKNNFRPGVRIRLFFAALSLNQNEFFCAMEVLPPFLINAISENIKCIIFIKSKRIDDALLNLKNLLEDEKGNMFVLQEVIDAFEKQSSSLNETELKEFQSIKKSLLDKNKVKNESLDFYLCGNQNLTFPSLSKNKQSYNQVR